MQPTQKAARLISGGCAFYKLHPKITTSPIFEKWDANNNTKGNTTEASRKHSQRRRIMDTIAASIIGVFGTILGVCIGYKFSIKASLLAIKQQEFNRAAAEFRAAFIEVQRLLAKHYTFEVAIDKDKPSVSEILEKFFVRHERAVIRFRPNVPQGVRAGFDKAWKTYCCEDDWNIPLLCYSQKGADDPNKEIQLIKLATGHIENLLSYAQPENN
jgi:hypothetical protein